VLKKNCKFLNINSNCCRWPKFVIQICWCRLSTCYLVSCEGKESLQLCSSYFTKAQC